MGRQKDYTDEEIVVLIRRLRSSEAVKLAKKEESIRIRLKKELSKLQTYEMRGKELRSMGITIKNIEQQLFADSLNDEE